MQNKAKIIYIMGPSGSGKDSVINGLRERNLSDCQIAHRYITRPWQSGGENHVELSLAEFEQRKALGFFAFDWSANHHHYGVGKEIINWLEAGQNVVLNGSRSYLPDAMALYPNQVIPVLIDVSQEQLRERLERRDRESQSEIEQRIERHNQLRGNVDSSYQVIENNSTIDDAVDQLVDIINKVT